MCIAHFFIHPVQAQTESYKSIIKKAENALLQRDRLKATQLLTQALEREGESTAAGKEIKKKLEQANSIFFSENAQKLYEQARSLRFKDEALAEDKLNEAQKLEPYNLPILTEKMKAQISRGSCDKIADEVDERLELSSSSNELLQYKLWSKLCAEGEPLSPEKLRQEYAAIGENNIDLQFQIGMSSINQDKSTESLNIASEIISKNLGHPGGYYLRWKVLSLWGQRATSEARKYLELCENKSISRLNGLNQDRLYCKYMKEVDKYLKAEVKATQDD